MAMSTGTAEGEVMVEMNTTPLIDVMLVMLTLLIITLPIQTHAVKLDMPVTQPPKQDQLFKPDVIDLGVDFDGTITWNRTPITHDRLLALLKREAGKGDTQGEIHLQPNRLAKYDVVAKILADAQRLGVKKIGFTGLEQYKQ